MEKICQEKKHGDNTAYLLIMFPPFASDIFTFTNHWSMSLLACTQFPMSTTCTFRNVYT